MTRRQGNTADVSVVIPNWNGDRHLPACLQSLEAQTYPGRLEVVVVDNGSTDDSLPFLRSHTSSRLALVILENQHNTGFAAACNQGIRAAGGAYIALLNNDAVASPSWIQDLVAALDEHPDVGSCTSKILSLSDPEIIDNVGHVVCRDGLTRGRGRLTPDRGQFDRVEEVFCASGAACLLRRAMLDDVGLFDEHFFAYCEDADLGFRARLRGWKCLYIPSAVVHHAFSASTGTVSALKARNVERNRLWLAMKNLPLGLLVRSPWHTLKRYFWQAWGTLTGQGMSGQFTRQNSALALVTLLLQAYLQGLMGLPRALRQRRIIQRRRTVTQHQVEAWLRQYGISARSIALMD